MGFAAAVLWEKILAIAMCVANLSRRALDELVCIQDASKCLNFRDIRENYCVFKIETDQTDYAVLNKLVLKGFTRQTLETNFEYHILSEASDLDYLLRPPPVRALPPMEPLKFCARC